MVSKFVIGAIITVILFGVGILMLSIFEIFSENWLIGIGLTAGGIGVIVITVYKKARS